MNISIEMSQLEIIVTSIAVPAAWAVVQLYKASRQQKAETVPQVVKDVLANKEMWNALREVAMGWFSKKEVKK